MDDDQPITHKISIMNIWLVTSEFPPEFGGGIATYSKTIASTLRLAGHRVTVIIPDTRFATDVLETVLDNGCIVARIPIHRGDSFEQSLGSWQLFSYRIAQHMLSRAAAGDVPDAIEIQDYGGLAYYILKRRMIEVTPLRSVPITLLCHAPLFDVSANNEASSFEFPQYWTGRTEKYCILAADAVVTRSHFLRNRLSYVRDDIQVCPLPFNSNEVPFSPAVPNQSFDLLFVGRMQHIKGILPLLSGMQRLWDVGRNYTLRVVGGDSIWHSREVSMKSVITERFGKYIERGHLHLDGPLPPEQLHDAYHSAKAAVVPSLYDNFPYVCIEAMAHGLPVVASKDGGHAELIGLDGSCGIIFPSHEPEAISAAVDSLLTMPTADLRTMGQAAELKVRQICDPQLVASRRIETWTNALPGVSTFRSGIYPFVNDKETRPDKRERFSTSSYGQVYSRKAGGLTVIVPYYNLARTVRETINSIMASSYTQLQVLLINDGSTDPASVDILDELRKENHRFPLDIVTIPNGGLANARNFGATSATTEYIAFLDADDVVLDTYYARSISILRDFHNVSYVYSWLSYFEDSQGQWVTYDTDFPYLLCANMLCASLVLRTQDFIDTGLNSTAMKYGMEDFEAWLRMAANGRLGVSIPEELVRYRVRANSMSRQFKHNTVTWLYETMVNLNPDIYRQWGSELAQLVYANGPGRLWNNPSLTYPPVGYGQQGTGFNAQVLANSFAPQDRILLLQMLNDPIARRVAELVLRSGLHKPVLRLARTAKQIRNRLRSAFSR